MHSPGAPVSEDSLFEGIKAMQGTLVGSRGSESPQWVSRAVRMHRSCLDSSAGHLLELFLTELLG